MSNEIYSFNELPIGAVFKDLGTDTEFIKFAHADCRPQPEQPPNSLCLDNNHYMVVGRRRPVIMIKNPNNF